jgi:hypothetical protein
MNWDAMTLDDSLPQICRKKLSKNKEMEQKKNKRLINFVPKRLRAQQTGLRF